MAKKPDITTIASGYYSRQALNNNFENLQDGFDNTLSLDGSTPNAMGADLDMNSNDILNAQTLNASALRLDGVLVSSSSLAASGATLFSTDHTGDGTTVAYSTTYQAFIKDNTQVYLDGVYQNKAGYSISGTTLTFSEAPPLNAAIEIVVARSLDVSATDAANVGYNQGGTGSVNRTVLTKLQETVSVKDFGAVGDGVTDDYAAFQAARTYCNDNDIHSLLIPPASYHLSEPWFAPQGGSYVPCRTIANGAVLDNTVIAQNGAGIAGLTVNGAPDAGFVFTRGQGAYHEYLVSKNNGSYGFYFGVASRQHLTVSSSSGFQVGETVTGGTSGKFGVVERIDGNVLRLIKCNVTGTAGFFQTSETVTGGTSGSSTTVSAVATPYGGNYQVTRATFNQLLSSNNGNKGWYWDGTATANRSWFNANTVISPSGVSNAGKGWVVNSYIAPGGGSQHNYNTFLNINMEGNGDQSLLDTTGRQNTYIGGHFVDTDGSGTSVQVSDLYNFFLGGRYIGNVDFGGALFAHVNKDTGVSFGRINNMDEITALGDLDVANEPLFYKGWSILPISKQTYTAASDNKNNHTLEIDMGDFITANYVNMRVFIGGFRNQSGGYNSTDHAQLTMVMSSRSGSSTTHHVSHSVASTEGITIDSVAISTAGVITITFDTINQIFTTRNIVEFYDENNVDPR
jgi:hypothetical protein